MVEIMKNEGKASLPAAWTAATHPHENMEAAGRADAARRRWIFLRLH